MGPCAGGAVYSPAITDFILMVEGTSYMFVTGPDVIKTVTHEDVTKEELGGAMTHNATSGVAHFAVADDRECLQLIRELLGYLPRNNLDDPPRARHRRSRAIARTRRSTRSCPTTPNQPYDMHDLIHAIADDGAFLEVHRALRAEHHRRLRAARRAAASASSPTSRRTSPARSTSTRRSRRRGSCASATPSTSRS